MRVHHCHHARRGCLGFWVDALVWFVAEVVLQALFELPFYLFFGL